MSRLTERLDGDGLCYGKIDCEDNCSYCDRFLKVLDKLAYYEDKQEQGLLIELPCKVGDTIYLPWRYNGQIGIANLKVTKIVIVTGVMRVFTDFTTDDEGFFEKFNGGMFDFSDFGEIVFLTRSEAEEALAKMGE